MATETDNRLRLLIERIERLEEEKKGIAGDIRDVYAEGKAIGYDAKIMREIVRLRRMQPDARHEMEALLETYKCALGLGGVAERPRRLEPTPLERAIAEATGTPVDVVELALRIQQEGGRVEERDGASVLVLPMGSAPPTEAAVEAGEGGDEDAFEQAVAIVRETGRASISLLQRRLRVGYNTAARHIDNMARRGIIGPVDAAGRRAVLAPAGERGAARRARPSG